MRVLLVVNPSASSVTARGRVIIKRALAAGVRGFLPASLVDIRRVQDLDEFLGQELRAKVIELNRSRNNVVLSRRAVLEEERKDQRQQILDKLPNLRLAPDATDVHVDGCMSRTAVSLPCVWDPPPDLPLR